MSNVEQLAVPDPATTHWVPVGPGPLPDFRYRGDWAAGSYVDGDIVVYGGVTYLCVLPTSAAPVAWLPPSVSPTYGTTLPASPVDGAEHVLVDSASNPTWQWRLRYNAGSTSAYKWEFVGGIPARAYIPQQEGTTSTSHVALATAGPQLTLPRAGEYDVRWGAFAYNLIAGCSTQMVLYTNGVSTGQAFYSGVNYYHTVLKDQVITAAAGPLVCLYAVMGGGSATWGERLMAVTPRRVS